MGRAATRELAAGAHEVWVKAGTDVLHFTRPLTDPEVEAFLVHEDGFLRVPILLDGGRLVRGYTENLYRQALAAERGA